MKTKLIGVVLIFIGFLLLSLSLSTCSNIQIKKAPEYKGVDPKVINLVNEFKDLAKIEGVIFKNEITIGFKNIGDGETVGLTTYGDGFREIDLDSEYWQYTDAITHWIILMHELGHAYCSRDHDYGEGKYYPDVDKIRKAFINGENTLKDGYYKDDPNCPLSIMHPILIKKDCFISHYNDYVDELFKRCTPW